MVVDAPKVPVARSPAAVDAPANPLTLPVAGEQVAVADSLVMVVLGQVPYGDEGCKLRLSPNIGAAKELSPMSIDALTTNLNRLSWFVAFIGVLLSARCK